MKITTRNSFYEIKGSSLYRNGVLVTDQIHSVGYIKTLEGFNINQAYTGTPSIGSMLFVTYTDELGFRKFIRTSRIVEVSHG